MNAIVTNKSAIGKTSKQSPLYGEVASRGEVGGRRNPTDIIAAMEAGIDQTGEFFTLFARRNLRQIAPEMMVAQDKWRKSLGWEAA